MYKSMICHLHSLFEGPASISGFCYEASRFNVDVVWLTDHDIRIPGKASYRGPAQKSYDFSQGMFFEFQNSVGGLVNGGWEVTGVTYPDYLFAKADQENKKLVFKTRAKSEEWQGASLALISARKSYRIALLCQPTVIVKLATNINPDDEDARLILRINLSQAPPDHEERYMDYVLGSVDDQSLALPLNIQNGNARLTLAEDVEKLGLGLDNTLITFELRLETKNGKEAWVELTGFEIETVIDDDEQALKSQQKLANQVGDKYGVNVLVNNEVSNGQHHMTCFGNYIPLFPYKGMDKPNCYEINDYIARNKGIVSINHPLSLWKRSDLTEDEKLMKIQGKAEEVIANDAWGARLIEVGFPEGKPNFTLEHHLLLWDKINLAGLHLCGLGVSDAHRNQDWMFGNNFANYVSSKDCKPENLVAGMKSGNMYMADPARFSGELSFSTDSGKTFGDTQAEGLAKLTLTDVPAGSQISWIIDGTSLKTERIEGDCSCEIDFTGAKYFLRAEVRDASNRAIILTNPLWIS